MHKKSDIKNSDHVRLKDADFNMIRDVATGIYVEVGTFHGGSAYAASQNAEVVHTIDIYRWQPHIWEEFKCDNVRFFQGTSVDFAKVFNQEIDVLFIDGSHEFDSVNLDIKSLEPKVKVGGYILFHDYIPGFTGVCPAVDKYLDEKKPELISGVKREYCHILKVRKV